MGSGVRAIIIYPMNALANDQMKRMRALLKGHPKICYGVYNGNTEHTQSKALAEYHHTYRDASGNPLDPAPNEIISREVMQRTPPHILITNYSMLEYMMLRPKDDAVFSGAKLKFIVLDEAHIYKGATGMETSLLMRRLRARISEPGSVQYILTSATLGGPDADSEILRFAEKLCGVPFKASGIIRSTEKQPAMEAMQDFPITFHERPLSLIWTKGWEEERHLDIRTLAYAPLGMGVLSGRYAGDDARNGLASLSSPYIGKLMTELGGDAAMALSWVYGEKPYGIISGFSSIPDLSILDRIKEIPEDKRKRLTELAQLIDSTTDADNIFAHDWNRK